MKHISTIEISSKPLANFWIQKAYRVPAGMFPVEMPFSTQNDTNTWPITEMVVNSVIADPLGGSRVTSSGCTVRGVAWDRGHGIKQVEVTVDGGKSWKPAILDKEIGRFAFRAFSFATGRLPPGHVRGVGPRDQQRGRDAGRDVEVQSCRLPQQRAAEA